MHKELALAPRGRVVIIESSQVHFGLDGLFFPNVKFSLPRAKFGPQLLWPHSQCRVGVSVREVYLNTVLPAICYEVSSQGTFRWFEGYFRITRV